MPKAVRSSSWSDDRLLADTEFGEDFAEQVVSRDRARYLTKHLLAQAQLLGEQLTGPGLVQRTSPRGKMLCGAP